MQRRFPQVKSEPCRLESAVWRTWGHLEPTSFDIAAKSYGSLVYVHQIVYDSVNVSLTMKKLELPRAIYTAKSPKVLLREI